MHASTAAGSLPASPSPPEAASLASRVESLLRFVTIMAVLLAAAALPLSSFFAVTEIVVNGIRQVSAHEIVARSGVRIGAPRFTVQAAEVATRVARHPKIAKALVVAHPSGRVEIDVTERRATAAIPYRNVFLLVDASGVLLEKRGDRGNLPLLRVEDLALPWVRVGDDVPVPEIGQTLRVLELLPAEATRGSVEIRMDSAGEFSFVAAGGLLVLLGPMRGLGERAAMFPQVISALGKQRISVQYVDLRFLDNVVLRPAAPTSPEGDEP